ncbi:MAG: hypothetical protein WBA74_23065, partial [Cyclobacteriaceae bacterium]
KGGNDIDPYDNYSKESASKDLKLLQSEYGISAIAGISYKNQYLVDRNGRIVTTGINAWGKQEVAIGFLGVFSVEITLDKSGNLKEVFAGVAPELQGAFGIGGDIGFKWGLKKMF